jgi:hypothetical protein
MLTISERMPKNDFESSSRKPLTCRMSLTNFITKRCIEYTLPLAGFKLTTLVVIGTESVIAQVCVNPTTNK